MCDFISWIEFGGKNYWLTDEMIKEAGGNFCNSLGHRAIVNIHPKGKILGSDCDYALGIHRETPYDLLPSEIRRDFKNGKMRQMALASGYLPHTISFDSRGLMSADPIIRGGVSDIFIRNGVYIYGKRNVDKIGKYVRGSFSSYLRNGNSIFFFYSNRRTCRTIFSCSRTVFELHYGKKFTIEVANDCINKTGNRYEMEL